MHDERIRNFYNIFKNKKRNIKLKEANGRTHTNSKFFERIIHS